MTSRAFVAGATGYTGRAVVQALRARDLATVAHVRPDSRDLAAWQERFTALGAQVDTTPWQEEAMAASLARLAPTVVFALLGTTRARWRKEGSAGDPYEKIDYGLSAILLRASQKVTPPPRFVYLSAIGVREGTGNAYLAARARLERELVASGLPHIIARPSFISGPDRDESRPGERVGAVVADALLGAAGLLGARRLRDRYASIHPAQLGEGLVRLALDPAAESRTYATEELRSQP
jgi:uncharacterized protein YbjT (DUF2867 family)